MNFKRVIHNIFSNVELNKLLWENLKVNKKNSIIVKNHFLHTPWLFDWIFSRREFLSLDKQLKIQSLSSFRKQFLWIKIHLQRFPEKLQYYLSKELRLKMNLFSTSYFTYILFITCPIVCINLHYTTWICAHTETVLFNPRDHFGFCTLWWHQVYFRSLVNVLLITCVEICIKNIGTVKPR